MRKKRQGDRRTRRAKFQAARWNAGQTVNAGSACWRTESGTSRHSLARVARTRRDVNGKTYADCRYTYVTTLRIIHVCTYLKKKS